VIEMPVIVIYDIPVKTPEDLFPFSMEIKEKTAKLLKIKATDLICCYSLESHIPNTKVCMSLIIQSVSHRDGNIKKKIIQQIDNIIKSKLNDCDCSEICSEFFGWPDVLEYTQQEEVI